MKKTYVGMTLVVISLLILNTLGIMNASAAGLQMTFTSNPTIAAPGTNGYIEVNLKSIGGSVSTIEISASSWDPTTVIPQGNWEVTVGSLDSGEEYSLIYEFRVPSSATPGLYQVVFEITGSNTIRQTAVVKVEDATILELTSVSPTSIRIGEATTLNFNITNNDGVSIENIVFIWEDPNDLILPLGADNKMTISSIGAENYTILPVVVMASSGISPGIYPLTITIEYYEQTGTKQTLTSTVGLQISGTTTFDVVVQQSTSSSTSFAIVNTGANTASSVVVSIPQQTGYTTSGSSSSSIGNLEAGDYTLASFSLTSTASNSSMSFPSFNGTRPSGAPSGGNFTGNPSMMMNRTFSGLRGNQLIIQIAYTDVFGVRQTIQKQVNLSSSSSSGFSQRSSTTGASGNFPGGFSGQSQSSGSSNSIVYIIIGVVGIIVIVAVIQLGRKKKLSGFSKMLKGRKE